MGDDVTRSFDRKVYEAEVFKQIFPYGRRTPTVACKVIIDEIGELPGKTRRKLRPPRNVKRYRLRTVGAIAPCDYYWHAQRESAEVPREMPGEHPLEGPADDLLLHANPWSESNGTSMGYFIALGGNLRTIEAGKTYDATILWRWEVFGIGPCAVISVFFVLTE